MPRKKTLDKTVLIEVLKIVADGVAGTVGSRCEIVVHDLRDLSCSIVKIANSHVTGRSVGGCMTDYGVRLLKQNCPENLFLNYSTTAADGRRMKSSTMLFRDESGVPVASLCINIDVDDLIRLNPWFQEISQPSIEAEFGNTPVETFRKDVAETLQEAAQHVLGKLRLPPTLLRKEDRLGIVSDLEEQGFFLIKGAVDFLAGKLGISKFSVYSYLMEIRKSKKLSQQCDKSGRRT